MTAERTIEKLLLSARWLLVPLYASLLLILVVFAAKSVQELAHLAADWTDIDESRLVLSVLSLIDMALVANLLLMVALSGYETFVSRFDTVDEMEKPGWLGKLDPGTVKLKVAASIVAISAIHLLRAYMSHDSFDKERLLTLTAVHLAFVVSALLLAFVDRLAFRHGP
ncbi:MAG TPA: TIGR00645 family protein [Candidatus Binatia bacterium]|nr:TIGR00645 family protein [Candidatus Binatia bacterium]